MGRRAWGTVAAASTVVIGLSACGGGSGSDNGNGVAARSPGQIIGAAISAAQGAGSVRVTGTTSGNNIEIVKGKGATGAISISGEKVRVVVTDSAAYLNGNRTFWQKTQPKAGALAGHWVRVPGAAADS